MDQTPQPPDPRGAHMLGHAFCCAGCLKLHLEADPTRLLSWGEAETRLRSTKGWGTIEGHWYCQPCLEERRPAGAVRTRRHLILIHSRSD